MSEPMGIFEEIKARINARPIADSIVERKQRLGKLWQNYQGAKARLGSVDARKVQLFDRIGASAAKVTNADEALLVVGGIIAMTEEVKADSELIARYESDKHSLDLLVEQAKRIDA